MGASELADTAALMSALDLIITSDTLTAHLAGALGIPVWVVLSAFPDWRWLLQREDSPWYPTMRLFRRRPEAGWSEVFERVAYELNALSGTRAPSS
jgi:ADP-heptose:LPS heptosyltransferase